MSEYAQRILLILTALLTLGSPSLHTLAADECLVCHEDDSLTMERGGKTVSLHVDQKAFEQSVHGGFGCTDCHLKFDPEAIPHQEKIQPVDCLGCHGDAAEQHSFHPQMESYGWGMEDPATSCLPCHGTHEIKSPKSIDSKFHSSHQAQACGACHSLIMEQFLESEHGKALLEGMGHAPNCLSCHEKPLSPSRNGDIAALKLSQEKMCLSCHLDDPEVRARMAPEAGFIAAYEGSVHGSALLAGNGAAANCVDCHGSHEMKHGYDPAAKASKQHIPETCSQCHGEIARQYAESAHAVALKRGNMNAPVCTDCHGEHNILLHTDPRSPVAAGNVSALVCSPCHSSLRLSEKYGIASNRFQTFADSYHGLAIEGGDVHVANCASCHGAHDIKRSSEPTSTVHKGNLAKTCGKCHPGANERFGIGNVHVVTEEAESPILYWIATLYISMILVVIGGMLFHNLIDFIKKTRRQIRARWGAIAEEEAGLGYHLRMTLNERIQHAALMISFIVLVITGFMLRYPDAFWVLWIRRLSDHAFELRSLTHRTAGVVMVLASLYHVGYLFTARGRRFVRDIFPGRQDLYDLVWVLAHNLGLRRLRPRFGRFSYVEKAEYWAVVWGTILMAATGAIMWFENTFIGMLTKLGWDIARTIHFYEAWLATLAIAVWHLYSVIFNPDVYPMNSAWITGRISEEEMLEEHPLELEAIRRAKLETDAVRDPEDDVSSAAS